MECVTLNNGVDLPALGLGVFQTPPEETRAAVETALADGYQHVDTAAAYGNERQVGEAIRNSGLERVSAIAMYHRRGLGPTSARVLSPRARVWRVAPPGIAVPRRSGRVRARAGTRGGPRRLARRGAEGRRGRSG